MPPLPHLHTTVVQAFARTVVDESRRDLPQGSRRLELVDSIPPPSATALPELEDVVGEHYKLVRALGEGMFGKVYVAQRVDVPEHQVALKLMPRSLYAGRNVERELVMLATVGHPHVVQLKDHGTTTDYVWLTMPVYHGETLAERLLRGPLQLREAHDIFLPIARGLEALHAAGLRHQDVKPENIFLAVFGGRVHPILLDLGVAAEREATFVAGTALYAAPEQVAVLSGGVPGIVPLSEKMDTYGLATTLLMALLGPKLFPGESARDRAELHEAHEKRATEPIPEGAMPDLTGPPRELLQKALASWLSLEQDDRPSMKELAEQLDVLLEFEREETRQEERRVGRQRATIQRFKLAVGAMLLLGLGGAGIMYSKRETLRVANELENARKKGSESFGNLQMCVASHEMAKAQTTACLAARDKDRADFKQTLDDVVKTGSTSEADRARQMQSYAGRVKTCEDSAAVSQRACTDEASKLITERDQQKAALLAMTEERDGEQAAAAAARLKVADLEKKLAELEASDKACAEERDSCKSATVKAAAALGAAGPKAAPAAGSSAAAAGSSAPAAGAPVVTANPAPPTPPAPPPAVSAAAPAPPAAPQVVTP